MKLGQVFQRIEAWKAGVAIPFGKTLPWPKSAPEDRLVVAFVRMAGESLPWGIAAGYPNERPKILTIPEPRDAGEMARLCRDFSAILLPHVPHPEQASEAERAEIAPVAMRRQLWLPGPTHAEMLHFFDFRYTLGRQRDEAHARELGALGRAAGWLFRESTRPGQVRVIDATTRIRETFAVPAEDVRQAHLGFLLAWLPHVEGTRDERAEAARRAESLTAGVTMDPELERERLEPLVKGWNAHRAQPEESAPYAAEIAKILDGELQRRWDLTVQAMHAFDSGPRPPNPELEAVLKLAAEEFTYQYWNTELKAAAPVTDPDAPRFLGSHPESDFLPAAAAARYFAHVHASELVTAELVHGDAYLVEEARSAGNAIRGEIVEVVNEGKKRAVVPVWKVRSPAEGALRLREESAVCVVGLRGRTGRIRSIEIESGDRLVTLEIDGWKRARPEEGAPAADDAKALVGTDVTLLASEAAGISRSKSMRVWDASGPGAWLTHSAPPPEPSAQAQIEGDLVDLVEKLGGS